MNRLTFNKNLRPDKSITNNMKYSTYVFMKKGAIQLEKYIDFENRDVIVMIKNDSCNCNYPQFIHLLN